MVIILNICQPATVCSFSAFVYLHLAFAAGIRQCQRASCAAGPRTVAGYAAGAATADGECAATTACCSTPPARFMQTVRRQSQRPGPLCGACAATARWLRRKSLPRRRRNETIAPAAAAVPQPSANPRRQPSPDAAATQRCRVPQQPTPCRDGAVAPAAQERDGIVLKILHVLADWLSVDDVKAASFQRFCASRRYGAGRRAWPGNSFRRGAAMETVALWHTLPLSFSSINPGIFPIRKTDGKQSMASPPVGTRRSGHARYRSCAAADVRLRRGHARC